MYNKRIGKAVKGIDKGLNRSKTTAFFEFFTFCEQNETRYFRSKYEQQGTALTEPDPLSVSVSQHKPNFHIYVISTFPQLLPIQYRYYVTCKQHSTRHGSCGTS